MIGNIRPLLLVLFGAVGLVLLIACANVGNLLMTRSLDRRKEFAVRLAMGANRSHLVVQLLVESVMLSCIGAVLGLLGALAGIRLLVNAVPDTQIEMAAYLPGVGINLPVVLFLVGVAFLTALLFGLGPGLAIAHTPIGEVLKEETRGGTSGSHARLRSAVVVAEIAMSMFLLIGGALLLHSLRTLLGQSPGFDPHHVLTFDINLPGASYPVDSAWPFADPNGLNFVHGFLDKVRALPGVEAASATSGLPARGTAPSSRFLLEGQTAAPGQEESCTTRQIDAAYFAVMRVPLITGRSFATADNAQAPPVAMVNQAWVKRYLRPEENALGKRVRLMTQPEQPFRQIVGVVGDLPEDSLEVPSQPAMYFPLDQFSSNTVYLSYVVRTATEPLGLVRPIQALLQQTDSQLAMVSPQSMDQLLDQTPAVFLRQSFFSLIGSFAAVALILAMLGLYGLMAYSVMQRTREVGIRMALGAQPRDILRLMLRQGLTASLIGVSVGLVTGIALVRLMSSLLYGIGWGEWYLFPAVGLLLTGIALVASYIPSRRATLVDPMTALRNE